MNRDGFVARAWQEKALAAWHAAGRHGIAEVVTGAGKTYFAMLCMEFFRANVPAATSIVVVPTNVLLDQWIGELISFFGVPYTDIIVLTGRSRVVQSRIHVGVINTVSKIAGKPGCPEVLLVVDECHRAGSEKFREALNFPAVASLGLSATPERQYDDALNTVLIPKLGPVIFSYDYRQALADGVIVPFALHNIRFKLEADEQDQYDKLTRRIALAVSKYGIEDPRSIELLIRRTRISNLSVNRVKIALKLVAKNPRRQILIFHEDIDACEVIRNALESVGVTVAAYHSKLTLQQRALALSAFRQGAISVLVSCRALDEGFNVPEAEIGIVAASTATYRQRIQRLGRILRPSAGKTHAEIYTLVGTEPEFKRLSEEASHVDDIAYVTWNEA